MYNHTIYRKFEKNRKCTIIQFIVNETKIHTLMIDNIHMYVDGIAA